MFQECESLCASAPPGAIRGEVAIAKRVASQNKGAGEGARKDLTLTRDDALHRLSSPH